MPKPENEPLETVLARLEEYYAADRDERAGDAFYNGADGQQDGLNNSMLPCLVAICAIPRNEPSDFARIFLYFVDQTRTHKDIPAATMVARIRAALFKATPLVGVVQVSNALEAMHTEILKHPKREEILAAMPKESQKRARTAEQDAKAGWEFFSAIYERHAQAIIDRIGESSPDLAEMIVNELYGANLSRDDVMSWRETVLLEFTGCAALDCPAQAKGHFFGSRNLKVGKRNVRKAIEVVRQMGSWRGAPLDDGRMPWLSGVEKWEA